MFSKEELDTLLENVGSRIAKSIKIYMIGGCALSFKGLKAATKDIDIIVTSKNDFDVFGKAMRAAGFTLMTERESEFYLTALAVYIRGDDSRIDVFLKQVGKMLQLTDTMIKRSELYKKYGSLSVYLLSNEDIFLFKTMTSRQGDLFDCDRLIKENLDYDLIYKEIVNQSGRGKRWFFWAYESFCRLENHNGVRISIKNKIFALVKKHWKERPSDFMVDINNIENHISDKKLLKELKIRK